MELHDFLVQRVHEDARIAQDASKRKIGGSSVIGGVDWFWSYGSDTDAQIHPGYEHIGGEFDFRVSLRSRQEWEVKFADQKLPQFAIPEAESVEIGPGVHITTFDPKRILKAVAAKRGILAKHLPVFRNIGHLTPDGEEEVTETEVCSLCVPRHTSVRASDPSPAGPCATLRFLGTEYDDHPDYREEWRPF